MLRTPPFAKAPLMLRRHPVVLVSVFGTALILGLVIALNPLFLSSAATAALDLDLEGRCESSISGSMRPLSFGTGGSRFYGVSEENRAKLVSAIGPSSRILEPRATIVGAPVHAAIDGDDETSFPLVLMHRTGFRDHAEVLSGGHAGGVWIDEFTAEVYGVNLGDTIDYSFVIVFENPDTSPPDPGDQPDVVATGALEVTAIISDLTSVRTEDFWCGVDEWIGFTSTGDRMAPVGLVDVGVFTDNISNGLDVGLFMIREEFWELPVDTRDLTLEDTGEIVQSFNLIGQQVLSDPDAIRSDLSTTHTRVLALQVALATSVRPLGLAVVLIALGLVAGAAVYWVDRRADELRLLSALGFGPAAVGLKAAFEMFIPLAAGSLGGAGVARMAAVWVGPGSAVDDTAIASAVVRAIGAIGASVALVSLVAAWRSRSLLSNKRSTRHSGIRTAVLGVGVGLMGLLVRRGIGDEAVGFDDRDLVGSVDPLVIVYPLLVFVAVALVTAEVLLALARLFRQRLRSHALFLANRRILSKPGQVVLLLAGALIPVATLVYSATLTESTSDAIQAKGQVFIGSDVRAPVFGFEPLPAGLAEVSTYVRRAERVDFDGVEVDFLVVDGGTFESGAFWRDSFSDQTLPEILTLLSEGSDPVPALVANGAIPGDSGLVELGRIDLPIDVVGTAVSFPGARGSRPLVVVESGPFDTYVRGLGLPPTQTDGTLKYIWVQGLDGQEAERQLSDAGVRFAFTTTIEEALDLTKFQAIIWTFDFLRLYAALTGLIMVGAILLYSDTRQRSRNLSYAIALKMGLTRAKHICAVLAEVGAIAVTGTVIGSLAAMATAASVYGSLDPLPGTPPAPEWVWAPGLLGILILLAVGVSFLAAVFTQRTADNADVPELLRHGG